MLKRLPGLEVSQDGSIQADGKGVTQLTVDGKTFFSDDPKFAIKNLPAEAVSKVQVFDKKDEEALLTGKSNSTQEKAMNVELKEEFKKGGFGKVTVGGGNDNRGELKGNYNKFDTKNQFSLVGVANNTGRNGLSWNDYQDFMGARSWDNDGGYTYGFGGNNYMSFGGNQTTLESKVSNAFFSGNSGGFPTNALGGINYNYDHEKHKFAGRYFLQNTGNEIESFTDTRTFLSAFNLDNSRYNIDQKSNINHRAETQYQWKIDSFFTIILTADAALANTNDSQKGNTTIKRNNETLTSSSTFDNSSELSGRLFNSSLLLRKKFRKGGRAIGMNVSYLKTNIDDDQKRFSDNNFYNNIGQIDSSLILRQLNRDTLDKFVIKANAMYSEPISKKIFWKTFYNFSARNEDGTRIVNDQSQPNQLVRNDNLSRIYSNRIINQRAGTSITYGHNGHDISIGGAFQSFNLQGSFASTDPSVFFGNVNKTFYKWLPFIEYDGELSRNTWFNVDYGVNFEEPTIENLLPVVDFSNPIFITEGNPNLLPTLNHRVGTYISHSWPADGIRIYANISYTYYEDQVIQEQSVDENLVTRSRPINYAGGTNLWSNAGISFPIVKNKLTSRMNLSRSSSNSFAFVNNVLNKTTTVRWSPSAYLDFTPSDNIALYVSSNMSFSNTEYDINTSQNQNIVNQNYNVDFNAKLGKGWFWNSTLRYSIFTNEMFGIMQEIPIINLSLYKQIFKGNRGEVRFSIYDVLNKNIQISQSTSVARVFDSRTLSLARYALLSFSYNIKGMNTSVAKKDNWF